MLSRANEETHRVNLHLATEKLNLAVQQEETNKANQGLAKSNVDLAAAKLKADMEKLRAEKAEQDTRKLAQDEKNARASTEAVSTTMLAQIMANEGQLYLAHYLLDQVPRRLRGGGWDHLKRALAGSPCTLYGHAEAVTEVSFNPDGTLLASASQDNTIKLWDLGSSQELRGLSGHTHSVTSVTFSPDGRLLASASQDKTVKLWDVTTGLIGSVEPGWESFRDAIHLCRVAG